MFNIGQKTKKIGLDSPTPIAQSGRLPYLSVTVFILGHKIYMGMGQSTYSHLGTI